MGVIRKEINKLIKKYNTNDPFELAELLKIHVAILYLHEDINGFYKFEQKNQFIIINKNLSSFMQRFVCAHELGHAILHPRENTPFMRKNTLFSVSRIEVEATTFAVELLLSDEMIYEYKETNMTIHEPRKMIQKMPLL